jgi:hypothetical protein
MIVLPLNSYLKIDGLILFFIEPASHRLHRSCNTILVRYRHSHKNRHDGLPCMRALHKSLEDITASRKTHFIFSYMLIRISYIYLHGLISCRSVSVLAFNI